MIIMNSNTVTKAAYSVPLSTRNIYLGVIGGISILDQGAEITARNIESLNKEGFITTILYIFFM
jgi:hypothetical protein